MKTQLIILVVALGALVTGARVWGQLPVTGVPVPQLTSFDQAVQAYMDQHNLRSGVVGVMKDGKMVYQRGFGYAYDGTTPLPEITPMRIGSISKRFVAQCIWRLAAEGAFGAQGTNARAFNVGQAGGGILNIAPWPSLGDSRIGSITVQHLMDHASGFNDWANSERTIANAMEVGCPPGIDNMIRFALGRQLVHPPGMPPPSAYVNFGYAVLARIIQQVSGLSLDEYVHEHLLTPQLWIPSTELFGGRPFRAQQNVREPLYASNDLAISVFDPDCNPFNVVSTPYGGFDLIATVGAGGLVCTPAALLRFLDVFQPPSAGFVGGISGTSACAVIRDDGVAITVLVSQTDSGDPSFAAELVGAIEGVIDAGGITWPTFNVEGFWLQLNPGTSGTGGYNDPFRSMQTALNRTTAGTRLRIRPGSTNWTGTISERMLIDAPYGTVRIGE